MKPPIEPDHIRELITSDHDEPVLIWWPHRPPAKAVGVISIEEIRDHPHGILLALREELQDAYPPPDRPYDPERDWCKRVAARLAEAYDRDVLPHEIAGGRP